MALPLTLVAAGLLATTSANAAEVVDRDHIDTSQTRATGHVEFANGGMHVWTEGTTSTDKAAGYFDVVVPLSGAANTEPTMTMTGTGSPPPGQQLVVDFDRDGNFDGILVGEPTFYGDDWWLTNGSKQFVKDQAPSTTGGSGSQWHGTLDQWTAAFPTAVIHQTGWSLGSGVQGDWTITEITVGANSYTFAGADYNRVRLFPRDINHAGTTAAASNVYGPDYVKVTTPTWDDVAMGMFAPRSGERLRDIVNPVFDPTVESGGKAGLHLRLDADGDGEYDGTLVYESVYNGMWWLTEDSSAAMRAPTPPTSPPAAATTTARVPRTTAASASGVPPSRTPLSCKPDGFRGCRPSTC